MLNVLLMLLGVIALPAGFVTGWYLTDYFYCRTFKKVVQPRKLPLRVIDNPMIQ